MMNPLTQAAKKLGAHGTYACYRVVVTNYDLSDSAAVVVRIYPPHINTIYPRQAAERRYPLEINGSGFGPRTYSR